MLRWVARRHLCRRSCCCHRGGPSSSVRGTSPTRPSIATHGGTARFPLSSIVSPRPTPNLAREQHQLALASDDGNDLALGPFLTNLVEQLVEAAQSSRGHLHRGHRLITSLCLQKIIW